MKAIIYYALVVCIWGTTWLAIKYQSLNLEVEHAIFYRFALAAMLLFAGLKITDSLRSLDRKTHFLCVAQGSLMFCLNFYGFYEASKTLSSGLLSIIFSTAIIMNSFNNWLWFSIRPTFFTNIGAFLGLLGIIIVFYPDVQTGDEYFQTLTAISLCILGTYSFSTGNMLSIKIRERQPHLLSINAWSIFYGACLMLLISTIFLEPYRFHWNPETVLSLLYLVTLGTIVVFFLYLQLVRMIGVSQVAYTTVLMPIVALSISTLFEDYQWTLLGLLGIVLIVTGNILVFQKLPKRSINSR